MTSGSAATVTKRSWTDRVEEPKNRFGMLIFFGTSALVLFLLFVWSLLPKDDVKTFATTISILNYGKTIPKLNNGVFDLEVMKSKAEENGLSPWIKVGNPDSIEKGEDINLRVTELSKDLKSRGVHAKDTLFIQLRCYAAVTRDEKENGSPWRCGLYIEDSASDPAYPIKKLMTLLLNEVPTKNIVLIADICDLKSAPHLGWIVNPVATYLRKAAEEMKSDFANSNSNLWIICPAEDHQSTYYSLRRDKTLFQEAFEQAFKRVGGKTELSLAECFKSIYQYCHSATKGDQTPLLIFANSGEDCIPRNQKIWQMADRVLVNLHQGKVASNKDLEKEDPTKKEASKEKETSKEKVGEESNSAIATKPETLDSDLQLRFWQLRDLISNRGEKQKGKLTNWSPADFAPLAWRKLQFDAARNPTRKLKDCENDCEALLALRNAIASSELVRSEKIASKSDDGWELCRAWNDFRNSNTNYRKLWEEEQRLVDPDWKVTCKEYRDYIDSISELTFWRDLTPEFPELRAGYTRLVECLKNARAKLPKEVTDAASENSKDMQRDEAGKARLKLTESLSNIVSVLNRNKNQSMDWLEDRKYQLLLSSPLITYESRKTLQVVYEKKEFEIVSNDPKALETFYKSRANGFSSSHLAVVRDNCANLTDIASLFLDKDILNAKLPSMSGWEGFLLWGKSYWEIMQAGLIEPGINDVTKSWHYLSLIELGFEPTFGFDSSPSSTLVNSGTQANSGSKSYSAFKSYAGIVVPPINPKSISISSANRTIDFSDTENKATVVVSILHVDNSPVDLCEIQWSTNKKVVGLSFLLDERPFRIGERMRVEPKSKAINLKCRLEVGQTFPDGVKIQITAIDAQNKESNVLVVPLMRNASRIDLVAKRVDDGGKSILMKGKDQNVFDLEGPAIKGAVSSFSFALRNKKETKRRVQLRVYALPSHDTPTRSQLSDENLFAMSNDDLEIPGYDLEKPEGSEIPVKLNLVDPKAKHLENDNAAESQLVFQIVEFKKEEGINDEKGRKKEPNPSMHYGRFVPSRPFEPKYLKIEPGPIKAKSNLRIDFDCNEKLWGNYSLKELPVTIRQLMTVEGQNSSVLNDMGGPSSKTLTAEETSFRFVGPVMEAKKQFRFEVDIGDYPRSVIYKANSDMDKLDLEVNESRVEIAGIRPIPQEPAGKDKPREVNGRYVFPNLNGSDYKGIEVDTKLDIPASGIANYRFSKKAAIGADSSQAIEIKDDRWFGTQLSVSEENGTLGVGFQPSELKIRHEIRNDLNGVYVFQITAGTKTAEKEIVFDRAPPIPSFVAWQDKVSKQRHKLFEEQTIDIWIEAKDDPSGSGVESAIFAIAANRDNPNSFMDTDEKVSDTKNMARVDGKIKFTLSWESFAKKPKNTVYYVVARTIDYAGNYQDKNTPLEIEWAGKPPKQ